MNTNSSPAPVPTPDEMQALVRAAHRERSQVVKELLAGLFRRRKPDNDRNRLHVPLQRQLAA